jgi:hypothetical protein
VSQCIGKYWQIVDNLSDVHFLRASENYNYQNLHLSPITRVGYKVMSGRIEQTNAGATTQQGEGLREKCFENFFLEITSLDVKKQGV